MEGRTNMMEAKMVEVQGELQCQIGSVGSEFHRLGSLEKNVGMLLEKMEILDMVDLALHRMVSGHPSWD